MLWQITGKLIQTMHNNVIKIQKINRQNISYTKPSFQQTTVHWFLLSEILSQGHMGGGGKHSPFHSIPMAHPRFVQIWVNCEKVALEQRPQMLAIGLLIATETYMQFDNVSRVHLCQTQMAIKQRWPRWTAITWTAQPSCFSWLSHGRPNPHSAWRLRKSHETVSYKINENTTCLCCPSVAAGMLNMHNISTYWKIHKLTNNPATCVSISVLQILFHYQTFLPCTACFIFTTTQVVELVKTVHSCMKSVHNILLL